MIKQIIRNIDAYQAKFSYCDRTLLLNFAHTINSTILFTRITDTSFPEHLKDIADNTHELYQIITDLPNQRLKISSAVELILSIEVGKRIKDFKIYLEKAEMSNEENLTRKIAQLQKKLQKKEFEANFFKEQYFFLLNKMEIVPNLQNLGEFYEHGDVEQLFSPKDSASTISSKSSIRQSKVGSAVYEREMRCLNMHKMQKKQTQHGSFLCNICRVRIPVGEVRYVCHACDFDSCMKCAKQMPCQDRKYCLKQHALKFGVANNYILRFCDLCKKSLAVNKGYTCLQCGYDKCQKCL